MDARFTGSSGIADDDEGTEMTANELTGKVAIVTGAGRNIGRAIALALADGGASIVVNARSNRAEAEAVAREIETVGGKALVHIGDVADPAAVQAMADAAMRGISAASTSSSTTRRCGGKSRSPRWTMPNGAKSWTSPSTARFIA